MRHPNRETRLASDESSAPAAATERRGDLFEQEIGLRAYAIWLAQGKPEGTHLVDWFEADRQLQNERSARRFQTHLLDAEQTREANEDRDARDNTPTNREQMVAIGRGNQQAGRQGS